MFSRVRQGIKTHWSYTLAGAALALLVVDIIVFYPGYMSNDSIGHLSQALGVLPVTDSQPVVTTLVWKASLRATGHIATMLTLQLTMLWAAFWLLAEYVWRVTGLRKLSLLPLLLGLLPFVVNIAGVVWSDVQMAGALLLAAVLLLYVPMVDRRWKLIITVLCLVLSLYAGLVRYNAALAVVPVVYLVISRTGFLKRTKWAVMATAAFFVVNVALFPLVNSLAGAQHTNPISSIMLDDISNVTTSKELIDMNMPVPIRESLGAVRNCAATKHLLVATYWACGTDADRKNISQTYFTNVQFVWLHAAAQRPFAYTAFKIEAFTNYLFPADGNHYLWQDGIVSNHLGQSVKFPRLGETASIYVNNFGYRYAPEMFEPWFWLLTNILLLIYARKVERFRAWIRTVAVSGIVYIAGYFATGATADFRYVYWPVLGALAATTLLFTEWLLPKQKLKSNSTR